MAMAMAMASCLSSIRGVRVDWKRSELMGTSLTGASAKVAVNPRQDRRLSIVAVKKKTNFLRHHKAVLGIPVSGRFCKLTGRRWNRANKISFSGHKTKVRQLPNLQYKRIWWERAKQYVRLRVCTRALKTVDKLGIEKMAKRANINLAKLLDKQQGRMRPRIIRYRGPKGNVKYRFIKCPKRFPHPPKNKIFLQGEADRARAAAERARSGAAPPPLVP